MVLFPKTAYVFIGFWRQRIRKFFIEGTLCDLRRQSIFLLLDLRRAVDYKICLLPLFLMLHIVNMRKTSENKNDALVAEFEISLFRVDLIMEGLRSTIVNPDPWRVSLLTPTFLAMFECPWEVFGSDDKVCCTNGWQLYTNCREMLLLFSTDDVDRLLEEIRMERPCHFGIKRSSSCNKMTYLSAWDFLFFREVRIPENTPPAYPSFLIDTSVKNINVCLSKCQ